MSARVIAVMEALRRREDVPMAQENAAIDAAVELLEAAQMAAGWIEQARDQHRIPATVTLPRLRAAIAEFQS